MKISSEGKLADDLLALDVCVCVHIFGAKNPIVEDESSILHKLHPYMYGIRNGSGAEP